MGRRWPWPGRVRDGLKASGREHALPPVDVGAELSGLRPRQTRGHAYRRLPVLLRMRSLQDGAAAKGWGLLRLLFVGLSQMPACSDAAGLFKLQDLMHVSGGLWTEAATSKRPPERVFADPRGCDEREAGERTMTPKPDASSAALADRRARCSSRLTAPCASVAVVVRRRLPLRRRRGSLVGAGGLLRGRRPLLCTQTATEQVGKHKVAWPRDCQTSQPLPVRRGRLPRLRERVQKGNEALKEPPRSALNVQWQPPQQEPAALAAAGWTVPCTATGV